MIINPDDYTLGFYPNIDKEIVIDWVADTDNLDMQTLGRVARGSYSCFYRQYIQEEQMMSSSGFNIPLGFRVALRPISKSDLNDYWLKEQGIDMLG
jgi:hypothetical protein